jgi:hypothetical protein
MVSSVPINETFRIVTRSLAVCRGRLRRRAVTVLKRAWIARIFWLMIELEVR